MGRYLLPLLLILPCVARAAAPDATINLRYQAYAHGFAILAMDVTLATGPHSYALTLSYRTTGLARFLFPGEQNDAVAGVWRGHARQTEISYQNQRPTVVRLISPGTREREPVPPALQIGTEDTLSALAQLVRRVDTSTTCDTSARIYDGRRLSEINARTVGMETVAATQRSIFVGPALRCDFEGHMLAGFLLDDNRAEMQRPLHGSAWFAAIEGSPPLPVRLQFETRWFGDVTMFLTAATINPTTPPR